MGEQLCVSATKAHTESRHLNTNFSEAPRNTYPAGSCLPLQSSQISCHQHPHSPCPHPMGLPSFPESTKPMHHPFFLLELSLTRADPSLSFISWLHIPSTETFLWLSPVTLSPSLDTSKTLSCGEIWLFPEMKEYTKYQATWLKTNPHLCWRHQSAITDYQRERMTWKNFKSITSAKRKMNQRGGIECKRQ